MLGISFEQLRFILHGAGWTLLLSLIGFAGGALLGLPLALLRSRGARAWGAPRQARSSSWCRAFRCPS